MVGDIDFNNWPAQLYRIRSRIDFPTQKNIFFNKIVMLRNRLRTLEQHVNASELPDEAKLKLQSYITACYGSLTSFNVLFSEPADQFKGTGGE